MPTHGLRSGALSATERPLPFAASAYADRIRQRVPQAIVFDIELAHACYGYLATREAIDGGNNNYSANIFNGVCHPDGGELFVEECADIIKSLF